MQRPRRECAPLGVGNRSKVVSVIPLPRPWLLAGAMLIGSAIGLLAGVAFTAVVHTRIRPDIVIALVVWVPSVIGLLTILFSRRRWVTMAGAFILALAPGWFGVLVALRVASGA
jgi:Putative holin